MVDFDPFESGLAEPEAAAPAAGAFDPFASGEAEAEFDPFAGGLATPEQSTTKNVVNQAGRGALDQGLYSGIEGAARLAAPVVQDVKASVPGSDQAALRGEYENLQRLIRTVDVAGYDSGGGGYGPADLSPEDEQLLQRYKSRALELGVLLDQRQAATLPARYADAVAETRAGIRQALPVDAEFERSLGGQIIAGLGQAAGTLPLYVVPGVGPGVTVGQMYDQGYQDAIAKGADAATANAAGAANIPAAALDVLADRLVIGKLLKPLKGRISVGQVAKAVAASAAGEGATEGAQQVWQNLVASRLVGYDPDRPLDDAVINSIIVGAVVGGTVSAAGQGAAEVVRRTGDAPTTSAAPEGGAAPVAPAQSEQDAAFDPFESGQAEPIAPAAGGVDTPAAAAPEAPAPLAFDYTPAADLSEEQRAVEQRMADIIKADPAAALDAYRQANTRDGVLVIDADAARSLSPDYSAGMEARGRLAAAVHEPASALAKLAYEQALKEEPRTGKVLFLAGGGGSGETAALEAAGADMADVVYDSTFGSMGSARARIKRALDSGRKAEIVFVYRPQVAAWEGVERRRMREGRSVPLEEFKRSHENALLNVLDLRAEFAKDRRVSIKFFDNSGARGEIQEVSWRDLYRKSNGDARLDEAGAALITQEIENEQSNTVQSPDGAGQGGGQGGASPGGGADGRGGPALAGDGRQPSGPPARQPGDGRMAVAGERGSQGSGRFVTRLPGGGTTVSGRWRVVDASRLVTSQDAGYAKELQPRDRTRAASEQQISAIVTNLDPELLGDSMTTDLGAPFIDRRGQVLSGNGRTLALRDAYAAGEPGARYRAYVEKQAARYGIDPQDAAALERPVLVREVTDFGELSPTEFARRSNQRQVLGMSESENATADAQRLRETPALLSIFNPSLEGDVLASSNREFLNQFIEATGDRAELVSRDGQGYSPKLAGRVRNAVLGVLLGPRERATLDQLIEAPEGLKKVVNGLLVSAPRLLRFQGTPYDLGPVLSKAVADYISLTRSGEKVETYLSQGDMMRDKTRTPEGDALLRVLGEARSTKRVVDFFEAYARLAGQQDTTTDSMFGDAQPRTLGELIPLAREAAEGEGETQAEFARRTADPEQAAAERARLAELQAEWRANAERIAPGLMQSFRLVFGDPSVLVRMGRAEPRNLTGAEEAAYLGHERMLFLFDQALLRGTDAQAVTNLLHEMGHAHWDTLPAARQDELLTLWREETAGRAGPLYTRGKLKRGVALGVESSVKEWYAERVAWANNEWARTRTGGAGLVGRMAQQFRQLLVKLGEYVAKLRGAPVEQVNRDFRRFLDQGTERWAEVAAPAATLFARRSPQQVAEDSARNVRTWLSRNLTSAAGLPAKVFEAKLAKDGRMASIAKQMRFALRDLDRAMHAVYGGYRAMTAAQLAELNEVLGGTRPLSTVDARLHAPLQTMRTHIDTLSARLVREGAIDAKLMARVGANIGFYLNRSYRKFDEPNWARDVPEAVRNRAESFIAAELAAQNPGQPVDPREVKGYVEYLLNKDTANESLYKEPAKLGAKSLDVMKARKDLPVELRELMGEYLDPRVNYLRSVAKTAQILEANRFLRDVRTAGLGTWLFPRPIVDASGSYVVPLAPKGSESMAPLNGLYTTKEIAQAFASQLEAAPGMALRAWLMLNGWAKVAKTVLSPVTQTRNLFGNLGFVVAGGHWRADAAAEVFKAMRAEFGVKDSAAARDYLARLSRLGVVGESVNAGELREALTDAGANLQGFEQWTDSRLMRVAKAPFKVAARLYQLNDEVFKIYVFENERRAWAKVEPLLTPAQLDTIAAERTRNTLPTYSLIPRAVQMVRRVGLTGSFLSFPSEIVRTTYHSIRYALGDLAAANPRQKAMGAKRLLGLAMVATLPAAVSMATRWLAGMDKDDEEDVRRFLPEWSKNSALYFTSADGKGRFGLIDASYLDPWNYLKKPLTAALRGEDWESSLGAAAREALDPFAGEGLVTKGIFDLARNRDDRGRMVFNPQAPFLDRTADQLAHVWSVYEPGIVTQARRIAKAAAGEVSPGGRVYDLENEVAAVLTGARRQDIDVAQSLLFRAKRFAGEKQGAELLFKEVRDRKGTVTPEELEAARAKMETARQALYAQISEDAAAVQRLGVSRAAVMQGLLGAGLGTRDAALILTGRYIPFFGQPDARRAALQQALQGRE